MGAVSAVSSMPGRRALRALAALERESSLQFVAVVGACQGCGACLLTCPEHAILPRGGELLVRGDRCSGCGECVEVCPVDAIELVGCIVTGGGP